MTAGPGVEVAVGVTGRGVFVKVGVAEANPVGVGVTVIKSHSASEATPIISPCARCASTAFASIVL